MNGAKPGRRPRKKHFPIEALEPRELMTASPAFAPAIVADAGADRPPAAIGRLRAGVQTSWDATDLARRPPPAHQAARPAPQSHRRGKAGPSYDLAVQFSYVTSPGNASVGIHGFTPPSQATVPAQPGGDTYQELGGVPYVYAIGRTEITAGQYVTFLNKVDPKGENPVQPYTNVRLWVEDFSPVLNPFSGQINFVEDADPGSHYRLAADFWRDKPLVNANLFHFAYFANSLYNGSTVAADDARGRSPLGFPVRTQARYVDLSTRIDTGMYDLRDANYPFFTRLDTSGYVIPSEDEWVKAAYFSPRPTGNGTHYYYYPTVADAPPTPLHTGGDRPTVDALGNVVRANLTPGVAYANYHDKVFWQPPYAPPSTDPGANVVSVGQASTLSPWLTYDQAGNVVEFTDTITAAPAYEINPHGLPVYVKAHGGIASAPDWQLWLTATGTTDPYGQRAGFTDTQGGSRFGYLPDAKADRKLPNSRRATPSRFASPPASAGLVYRLLDLASREVVSTPDLAAAVRLAAAPTSYTYLGAIAGPKA
ncbi:hypothetical protein [Planctomyces sp. SH-PL62]|uniref:hypothetical protein n=1 Tax=Planctomyces sp. SH-PL62 TaxID=1636152 RepID=UPI00078EED00|nr:hypothetical protein [Planctomyces sp. SH-PL62]AMV37941.1 hypothetical protein VT85_10930 [Planctomyces sp. SH-PL62]